MTSYSLRNKKNGLWYAGEQWNYPHIWISVGEIFTWDTLEKARAYMETLPFNTDHIEIIECRITETGPGTGRGSDSVDVDIAFEYTSKQTEN